MSPTQRPRVNRQFVLKTRPVGLPKESDFELKELAIPELKDGEVLVRAAYLSVDPYMRGRISGMKSYAAPVEIGGLMVGGGVAQVVESHNPAFAPGDFVDIYMGWQEYAISSGKNLRKLDPSIPVSTALGVLGMTGLSAYFGLLDVCHPKAGETVVVSGAAGAVGSVVGQIAKIKGCRTVGIAGGDDKVEWIKSECGYDEAFTALNIHSRISICGQISQYNNTKPELGPRLFGALIVYRAKVQGFLVSDYAPRFGQALPEMAAWVRE